MRGDLTPVMCGEVEVKAESKNHENVLVHQSITEGKMPRACVNGLITETVKGGAVNTCICSTKPCDPCLRETKVCGEMFYNHLCICHLFSLNKHLG